MNRTKRLAKEGSWVLIGQAATLTGALALVSILTEYLDPRQYGELALGLTIAGLVNASVMGVVTNGIARFYPIAIEKQDFGGYFCASRRMLFYATLATVGVGFLFVAGLLLLGFWQWIGLTVATIVLSLLGGYNSIFTSVQNAARQRVIVAFHGGLEAWMKVGLALSMMFWLGNASTSVVVGYASSSMIILLSQLFFLRRIILNQQTLIAKGHQWMREMWGYSLPFATWGVIGWAQQSSARWALEFFTSTETVGLYSVVTQLGYTPLQVVVSSALAFLTPILFARAGDGTSDIRNNNIGELINKIVIFSLVLIALATFVAATLHSYIFQLLVNDAYFSVSHFLPWVVLSGGMFSVGLIFASRIMALLMPSEMIGASIGSSLIGIVAAFVGTYYFSLAGAIASMVVHSLTYLLWIVFRIRVIAARSRE